MTQRKHILYLLAVVTLAWACSKKEKAEEQMEWPEMDAFHLVMAESFHPFKDSGNLEPAKRYAAELAQSAAKWADAPLPEKVNKPEVKEKIALLKSGTAHFAVIVQNGDDTQIGEALTSLHDLFHELQEAWYGRGEGHHEHKH